MTGKLGEVDPVLDLAIYRTIRIDSPWIYHPRLFPSPCLNCLSSQGIPASLQVRHRGTALPGYSWLSMSPMGTPPKLFGPKNRSWVVCMHQIRGEMINLHRFSAQRATRARTPQLWLRSLRSVFCFCFFLSTGNRHFSIRSTEYAVCMSSTTMSIISLFR